jgi:hypothetical protein
MAFSNGDAKKKLLRLSQGLAVMNVSFIAEEGFPDCSYIPVIMILTAILMWFAYYVSLIQAGDNSGLGWKFYLEAAQLVLGYGGWISIGATAVVAIFFILINYSTVLVYLSIPEDIRNRSTLITSLRSTVKKIALYLWGSATLLSVVGMITDWGFTGREYSSSFIHINICY